MHIIISVHTHQIHREVKPYASFFRKTLKVTFFDCTEGVQFVCDRLGVQRGDALIVERPNDIPSDAHGARRAIHGKSNGVDLCA